MVSPVLVREVLSSTFSINIDANVGAVSRNRVADVQLVQLGCFANSKSVDIFAANSA